MKQAHGLPNIYMTAALSGIAFVCGIFVLLTTGQQTPALVAAIFCLALGQVFIAMNAQSRDASIAEELHMLNQQHLLNDRKYAETFAPANLFDTEITDLKRRSRRFETDLDEIRAASRMQFQEITKRYEQATANIAARPAAEPAPAAPLREQLNILLQPIIDLSSNATAHYRTRFSITASDGREIDFEKLVVNADRGGLRPGLDVHVTNNAIPLLRRLRVKNPDMKMFIPIGAATLTSEKSLAMVTDALSGARDVAAGIVFELSHGDLGRLNEAGVTGLASIARMGATMALMNASVGGLDFASLRHLGVKFIGIDANSVDSGVGVASTWLEFVQIARGYQFQIILTDVINSKQAASSAQIARFVSGPFFAPARKVKFNAGLGAQFDLSAAA